MKAFDGFATASRIAASWLLMAAIAGTARSEDLTPPVEESALWYRAPARDWEKEALPIGNGRLGGMVFGGVEVDLQWRDGQAIQAVLRARRDGKHVLRAPKGCQIDGPTAIELKAGEAYYVEFK